MIACSTNSPAPRADALQSVNPQQWQALASRSIYFGHQSVGRNILDGVQDLIAQDRGIALKISSGIQAGPGLHEFAIGENGDPASKIRDFSSMVSRGNVPADAIFLFKFCYVDVTRDTDVMALFQQYRKAVTSLHQEHPSATVVHVTMPLTTSESMPEFLLRQVLGRPSRRQLNTLRNRYNDLLRAEYRGKETIFDLAEAESTRADGSRTFFTSDGKPVYTLDSGWTTDGGHLNEHGRRFVAAQLLAALAQYGVAGEHLGR